ncbi:MAG: YhcB family protein [Parahaliea sp.]
MYSLTVLLISAVVVLIAGLFIGLLIGRRSSEANTKYREAERKLDQVLQDKRAYEDEVVEHFTKTAKLLNNLTDSYRDVHAHLATGAATLCQGQGPVLLDEIRGVGDDAEIPPHLASISQPLDYAPKSSPEEKGMLNEEFGLDRQPVSDASAAQEASQEVARDELDRQNPQPEPEEASGVSSEPVDTEQQQK